LYFRNRDDGDAATEVVLAGVSSAELGRVGWKSALMSGRWVVRATGKIADHGADGDGQKTPQALDIRAPTVSSAT